MTGPYDLTWGSVGDRVGGRADRAGHRGVRAHVVGPVNTRTGAVGHELRAIAGDIGRAAEQYMPMSGSSLNFSNYEARRARVTTSLVGPGVSAADACRALADAFGAQAQREVLEEAPGVYRVTNSEFTTTDPVLAQAVAREYDKLDRFQYPTIGTETEL